MLGELLQQLHQTSVIRVANTNHISTSQRGLNGRRDKPPPPAVVRVPADKQTNSQTAQSIAIAYSLQFSGGGFTNQ